MGLRVAHAFGIERDDFRFSLFVLFFDVLPPAAGRSLVIALYGLYRSPSPIPPTLQRTSTSDAPHPGSPAAAGRVRAVFVPRRLRRHRVLFRASRAAARAGRRHRGRPRRTLPAVHGLRACRVPGRRYLQLRHCRDLCARLQHNGARWLHAHVSKANWRYVAGGCPGSGGRRRRAYWAAGGRRGFDAAVNRIDNDSEPVPRSHSGCERRKYAKYERGCGRPVCRLGRRTAHQPRRNNRDRRGRRRPADRGHRRPPFLLLQARKEGGHQVGQKEAGRRRRTLVAVPLACPTAPANDARAIKSAVYLGTASFPSSNDVRSTSSRRSICGPAHHTNSYAPGVRSAVSSPEQQCLAIAQHRPSPELG